QLFQSTPLYLDSADAVTARGAFAPPPNCLLVLYQGGPAVDNESSLATHRAQIRLRPTRKPRHLGPPHYYARCSHAPGAPSPVIIALIVLLAQPFRNRRVAAVLDLAHSRSYSGHNRSSSLSFLFVGHRLP